MGDNKIKVGIVKDLRYDKLNMQCMSRTLETSYDDLLNIIKNNMKGTEYEVSDEGIIVNIKEEAMEVKSIKIDEEDIIIDYTPLNEMVPFIEEIEIEKLMFKDQIIIINYLITKVNKETIEMTEEEFTSEWR